VRDVTASNQEGRFLLEATDGFCQFPRTYVVFATRRQRTGRNPLRTNTFVTFVTTFRYGYDGYLV
jgi:hypothetical protein